MGSAMLKGWLAQGISGESITVVDTNPSHDAIEMCNQNKVKLQNTFSNPISASVLVLAVKPQTIEFVAAPLTFSSKSSCLVLSIMAGVSISRLNELFGDASAIVRAMPNLAAMVGKGITVVLPDDRVDAHKKAHANYLLRTIGIVEWIATENEMDAATAVSGSGPGYLFHFIECLEKAGIRAGLPTGIARRLASATLVGAGAIMDSTDELPATLRDQVASPGGTTEAGLGVLLHNSALQTLITNTVLTAKQRAVDLS